MTTRRSLLSRALACLGLGAVPVVRAAEVKPERILVLDSLLPQFMEDGSPLVMRHILIGAGIGQHEAFSTHPDNLKGSMPPNWRVIKDRHRVQGQTITIPMSPVFRMRQLNRADARRAMAGRVRYFPVLTHAELKP